jgi:hypothetical protein
MAAVVAENRTGSLVSRDLPHSEVVVVAVAVVAAGGSMVQAYRAAGAAAVDRHTEALMALYVAGKGSNMAVA